MILDLITYVRRIFQLRKIIWAREWQPRPHKISTEANTGAVITDLELSHHSKYLNHLDAGLRPCSYEEIYVYALLACHVDNVPLHFWQPSKNLRFRKRLLSHLWRLWHRLTQRGHRNLRTEITGDALRKFREFFSEHMTGYGRWSPNILTCAVLAAGTVAGL